MQSNAIARSPLMVAIALIRFFCAEGILSLLIFLLFFVCVCKNVEHYEFQVMYERKRNNGRGN